MASKIKVDQLETADGTGTIALQNQLSGLASSSMPTGSVLQVVQGHATGTTAVSSNTFTATTLFATITPSSASSKVLIDITAFLQLNASAVHGVITVYRDSTNLGGTYGFGNFYSDTGGFTETFCGLNYLDSPNTTSAITYKFYIRRDSTGTVTTGNTNRVHSITLSEIAG